MNKKQKEFIRKSKKIDKLCEEFKDFGRMQLIDRIADSEIDKENLIKYLKNNIEESKYDNDFFRYTAYEDVLEKVKSGKYE